MIAGLASRKDLPWTHVLLPLHEPFVLPLQAPDGGQAGKMWVGFSREGRVGMHRRNRRIRVKPPPRHYRAHSWPAAHGASPAALNISRAYPLRESVGETAGTGPAVGVVLKASAATGGSWPASATASEWSPKLWPIPTTQLQLPRVLWPAVRGTAVFLGLVTRPAPRPGPGGVQPPDGGG
jgi:hypothetical protein